jgi:hypothetical protein
VVKRAACAPAPKTNWKQHSLEGRRLAATFWRHSARARLEQPFDLRGEHFRALIGSKSPHNIALAVDEELGEIPLDFFSAENSALGPPEKLIERMSSGPVDLDFREDWERDAVVPVAKGSDLVGGTRFLSTELIAWEAEDFEAAIFQPEIEPLEIPVLGGEAALTRSVHNQEHSTFELAEAHDAAIEKGRGKVVDGLSIGVHSGCNLTD